MKDEKNKSANDAKPEESKTQPTPPKIERLQLPLGAVIAFRKSGGLRFTSRELVIYPGGRVSFGGPDLSKEAYARAPRMMNDAQVKQLRRMLDRANFFRLAPAQGDQPPDAYAYEIVARSGNRTNFVEVFDGGIPDALAPLLEQLNALFPKEG